MRPLLTDSACQSIVCTAFQNFSISYALVSTNTTLCAVLICVSEFLVCGGAREVIIG